MKKIALFACGLLLTVCGVLGGLYTCRVYLPGQEVNKLNATLKTKDAVIDTIVLDLPKDIALQYKGDVIPLETKVQYDVEDSFPSFTEWLLRTPIDLRVEDNLNYQSLVEELEGLYKPCKDSKIIYSTVSGYELVPEVEGFDFDVEVVSKLLSMSPGLLVMDQFVKEPCICSIDLQDDFDKLSWLNNYTYSYSCGLELNHADLEPYVNSEGIVVLPSDYFDNVFEELVKYYDTTEDLLTFKSSITGEEITMDYGERGTFGFRVNKDKELEFLTKSLEEKESYINRVPELSGYGDFGNTYLEISIEAQHIWYYKDGEVVSDSDIVTGHKGHNDTPIGVYYISECIKDKILRGANYATPVDYWMRLTNSGIGLHDATWRSKFGDNIYTYDGSHGCINLPYKFAKELFKDSYVGMPVVIY